MLDVDMIHILLSPFVGRRNRELMCESLSRLGGLATKVRMTAEEVGS